MSSPQSMTEHEDQPKKNLEQITFRFCAECANMLYPKEDEDSHKLQFTCRTCQYTEEAVSTCVFRNILNNAAGETAGVTQDVGSDPTVGLPDFAGLFGHFGSFSAFTAFVENGSLPGVNPGVCAPSASRSSDKPIMCACCGGLITCSTCDEVFLAVPGSTELPDVANLNDVIESTESASTASTPETETISTPSLPTFSPEMRDVDDFDFDINSAADCSISSWLSSDKDYSQYSLFGEVADEDFYDFMD